MVEWPNWLYTVWSYFLRISLYPIVLPVRLFEKYIMRGYNGTKTIW